MYKNLNKCYFILLRYIKNYIGDNILFWRILVRILNVCVNIFVVYVDFIIYIKGFNII